MLAGCLGTTDIQRRRAGISALTVRPCPQDLGRHLRDLGRLLCGKRHAIAEWHGNTIAGVNSLHLVA
jgi:hypothetical protein